MLVIVIDWEELRAFRHAVEYSEFFDNVTEIQGPLGGGD